jgi:hypothetical protein
MVSPVERTLVAFTTLLISAGVAHASHPQPTKTFELSPLRGRTFARQILAPQPRASDASDLAQSRTIYLNRSGVTLRPGINDSRLQTSSIVESATSITPWEIDDEMWGETMDCMRELFQPFDVVVTDRDPGMVPHIEGVFGGHPSDVGLPDNVAGVSPFTSDCSVIESSVVFTFTDVLPDDARLMCEIMAQEIAHSYGLDHQMLPEDPMTYLDYPGERTFQDEDALCGEFDARPCGIGGSFCRATQNSVELLTQRLGARGTDAGNTDNDQDTPPDPGVAGGGCSTGGGAGLGFALALLGLIRPEQSRRVIGIAPDVAGASSRRHTPVTNGVLRLDLCSYWSSKTRSTSRRRSSTTCAPMGSTSGSPTRAAPVSRVRRRTRSRT